MFRSSVTCLILFFGWEWWWGVSFWYCCLFVLILIFNFHGSNVRNYRPQAESDLINCSDEMLLITIKFFLIIVLYLRQCFLGPFVLGCSLLELQVSLHHTIYFNTTFYILKKTASCLEQCRMFPPVLFFYCYLG